MMPQDRTAIPAETEWRAEQIPWDNADGTRWCVTEYYPGRRAAARYIVNSTDKITAKQMIADHGKAALCEELADAVQSASGLVDLLCGLIDDGRNSGDWEETEDLMQNGMLASYRDEFEQGLAKAGRTPG